MSFTTAGADNPFVAGSHMTDFIYNPDTKQADEVFARQPHVKNYFYVDAYYNAIFDHGVRINTDTDQLASAARPASGILFPRRK